VETKVAATQAAGILENLLAGWLVIGPNEAISEKGAVRFDFYDV